MKPRSFTSLCLLAFGAWIAACSSGLGNDPRNKGGNGAANANAQQNLATGLDLGVALTAAVADPAIAGAVVPAIGSVAARDVVLLAFTTAAASDNADGNGTPLSRDTTGDSNGASDVFVALVSAQDVERRAFSQSLAGKFRHPRCKTCHSMQAADTLAFVSSATGFGEPHAGPPPGASFPNNQPAVCAPCHVTSSTFPVEGWQAPASSFDIRPKTVAQLAQMARNVPADETEHFVTDRRVLWALDSGVLPQVGGRNGIADDDHDGVVESTDRDGIPRTVPGGSAAFLRQITDWRATATPGVAGSEVDTTAAAVLDVTLVSRASGTNNAANGASTAPRVKFVANGSFDPNNPTAAAIGTLFVAFTSTASNLVGGDTNGVADVFRAAVELRAAADGSLDLEALNTANILCSARNAATTPGNGASDQPSIGGANGEVIAFRSTATNLIVGFSDGNGAGSSDVFVRNVGAGGAGTSTLLVSHATSGTTAGANGASEAPNVAASGDAIAFESDATNLIVGDTNGVRDVFYVTGSTSPFVKTRASVTASGTQGSGGACGAASVHSTGTRIRVAFESQKTDMAATTAATNVFLVDSDAGTTTLLNQLLAATGTSIGNGAARAPAITADGAIVAFQSEASNIEVFEARRPDTNGAADVFLVETAQVAAGRVLPFRISITTAEGAASDGASTAPVVGAFTGSADFGTGFAAYTTAATNLGTSDTTNLIVAFLDETSGVIATFDATPVVGIAPLKVQFTDTSTGFPTSWQWDFDNDGNVDSTQQNPSFTFQPGTYSVRLVASNGTTEGTVTRTSLVRAIGPITPDFSATPTIGAAPLSVAFTDLSTEQPTSWQWDFDNDGNVDSTQQNPTFVYSTPGTYTVRLVATNEVGARTTTKAAFITVVAPTDASFTRTPGSGTVPFAVQFTDTTVGSPTSWQWDFDEDNVVDSTLQNPSFTYTVAGTFDVRLTASGPGGTDTFTFSNCVVAGGNVNASFNQSANSAYTTTPVTFTDTSTGTITSWAWDFENDGIVDSTLQNPTHSFSTTSVTTFTVRLTVSGPGGAGTTTRTFTSVAASESLNVTPTQDTTIYSNNTGNANGANSRLVIGKTYINGFRRSLIQFDVSAIPTTATVLTATLRLTDASPSGTGGSSSGPGPQLTGTQTFEIRRVTTSWAQGTGDASAGVGESAGASATFATMGANFDVLAGSITISNPPTSPWPLFTSSSLVSGVQAWVTTPSSNFGWMLKASNAAEGAGTSVSSIKWVESSEGTSPPVLAITYQRQLPP